MPRLTQLNEVLFPVEEHPAFVSVIAEAGGALGIILNFPLNRFLKASPIILPMLYGYMVS